MICPKCSNQNKENAKFCDECGYKLSAVSTVSSNTSKAIAANIDGKSSNAPKSSIATPAASSATQVINPNNSSTSEKSDVAEGKTGSSSYTTADKTQVINPYAPDTTGVDSMVDGPDYWGAGYTTQFPHISNDAVQKARVYKTDDIPSKKKQKKRTAKKSSMPVIPMGEDVSAEQRGTFVGDAVFSSTSEVDDFNGANASVFDVTPASKSKKVLFISLVIIFILGIAAFGSYQAQIWGGKVIPELVGMSSDESVLLLQDCGFKVVISDLPSDDVPGRVLYVHPSAGKRVQAGSEIELQVAVERIVPDVMGKSEDQAKLLFEEFGYTNVEFTKVKSEEAEGKIITVHPEVGTPLSATSKITVSVADPYKVPDVIGLSESEAISEVEKQGLVPNIEYFYNDNPEDMVFEVEPAVGEILSADSEVLVKIAKSWSSTIVQATSAMLYPGSQFNLDYTAVEVVSVDSEVSYVQGNTTLATVTVKGYVSLLGEVIYGTPKQYNVYFEWSDDAGLEGAHT